MTNEDYAFNGNVKRVHYHKLNVKPIINEDVKLFGGTVLLTIGAMILSGIISNNIKK